eukprot:6179887-Pleurochrysis_carterae.AAC.4
MRLVTQAGAENGQSKNFSTADHRSTVTELSTVLALVPTLVEDMKLMCGLEGIFLRLKFLIGLFALLMCSRAASWSAAWLPAQPMLSALLPRALAARMEKSKRLSPSISRERRRF